MTKIVLKIHDPIDEISGQVMHLESAVLGALKDCEFDLKLGPLPASVLKKEVSKLLNRLQA